jgi:transposase-like protein
MKGPVSSFSDEEKRKAIARLANEKTADVAKHLGIDRSTLRKWARSAGVKMSRPHPTYDDATKRAVVARVEAGEQRKDVAKETGVSTHTITVWKQQLADGSERSQTMAAEKTVKAKDLVHGKPRVKPYHPRNEYSDEFKLEALARIAAGERKFELAKELGIHASMLRAWEIHFKKHPPKRAYVRRAPELPGNGRPLEKSVASAIALLKSVRGAINMTDPVHTVAMVVLHTLEGKM